MPDRAWDVPDWFANVAKARDRLGWKSRTPFAEGLQRTVEWYRALPDKERYRQVSKKFGLDAVYSVSVVVACFNDGSTIPELYDRLQATFARLNVDFEIILVDDGSLDESEAIIQRLSRLDRRVTGIGHSRHFGPQAAFRSGLEVAARNATVLILGNLQDPPELIEAFGRSVARRVRGRLRAPERPGFGLVWTSGLEPRFIGSSTTSRRSGFRPTPETFASWKSESRERSSGSRNGSSFSEGSELLPVFDRSGVPYEPEPGRLERPRGRFLTRVRRAKNGLLSFSNVPLTILSLVGVGLFGVSLFLGLVQVILRVLFPERSASGITTVLLFVLFFGALNAFAVGLIGEYVGRIFEEVKRRPHFIRRVFVSQGDVRQASDHQDSREA